MVVVGGGAGSDSDDDDDDDDGEEMGTGKKPRVMPLQASKRERER